ncbi:hypothetical protein I6F37_32845 [Bradyrhizobium sp. NBAIM08]|nr:hypothetical protein [Bradyrhizobium sp. NBAIM08]
MKNLAAQAAKATSEVDTQILAIQQRTELALQRWVTSPTSSTRCKRYRATSRQR